MNQHWDSVKIARLLDGLYVKVPEQGQRKNVQEEANQGRSSATRIDVLITFDGNGVSGHPNHKSLYTGAVRWLQDLSEGSESPVTLYRLTSINMIRKYVGLLDMPFTLLYAALGSTFRADKKSEKDFPRQLIFLNDFSSYRKSQKAMTEAHKSQMVWFRWGWIILSRYMVINDLVQEGINTG